MTMAAISPNAARPAEGIRARPFAGLADLWRRWTEGRAASGLAVGSGLLCIFWGSAVAVGGLNALYLCVSLIGCIFILLDFRVGVVLLILLLPISSSAVFPHALLGITGLNPLNLLLAGTLVSYVLRSLFDGSLRRFMPRPLLWLYVAPVAAAGALGARHVGDIAPIFFVYDALDFHDAGGYLRDLVAKPLLMVLSALLVGAAVAKSEKPERFLAPIVLSIWVMCALVIVYFLLGGVGLREMGSSASREILTTGLGMHANELGRVYAVAYALLLFTWAETEEPGPKAVLLATMGVVVAALMLTFSRGAFFGFVVVNVLFLLWRRNVKTLIFCGVLAACVALFLPAVVYERIATGFGSGLNAISAGRIEGIWLPLAPEVLRSPLYGNGVGSILWSEAMRREGGISMLATTHPHNAYLETLLDMGMAGLLLVGAYFAHVWKGFRGLSVDPSLNPALRGFYLGAVAGLASFLIAALADSSLRPKPEQAFLWLAIGMMYGERARKAVT